MSGKESSPILDREESDAKACRMRQSRKRKYRIKTKIGQSLSHGSCSSSTGFAIMGNSLQLSPSRESRTQHGKSEEIGENRINGLRERHSGLFQETPALCSLQAALSIEEGIAWFLTEYAQGSRWNEG